MKEAGLALAASALLLTSLVHAEPVEKGTLFVDAGLSTSAGTAASGDILAAFWPTTDGLRQLAVEASHLRVTIYEFDEIDTLFVRHAIVDHSRSYELSGATISLEDRGQASGWVGLYGGRATSNDLATGPLEILATKDPIGNSDEPANGAPDSLFPLYAFNSSEAYIHALGQVELARAGEFTIKLVGPTIRIEARENETTLWTGTRPHETLPGQTTSRWIVLSTGFADVQVAADDFAEIALGRLHFETNGTIQVGQASGEISLPTGRYLASHEDATLSGALRLDISTNSAATEPSLIAAVGGSLESSTLAFTRTVQAPRDKTWPVIVGAILLAGVLSTTIMAARRRNDAATFSVDEFVDLANKAADEQRYGDALGWVQRAREAAPASIRLILDEGTFHERTGDVTKALECYAAASRMSDSGEADYLAAILLNTTHGDDDRVASHLIEAIRRTPTIALELEDDALFERLLLRDDTKRALAAALRDLEN